MAKKEVEDYLTEGMYGIKLPKQGERNYFLGTLRERIVIALTIGQVMSDKGLHALEQEIQANKGATLLFNGKISSRFLKEEKSLANKYNIPFTVVTNEEADTDIGAVLTYDYAIDKEDIFMQEELETVEKKEPNKTSFKDKLKKLLR
ncbi:YueI family protein [Ornithinibacillus bavariensis]|uniref:DUF1694 domain-containing protein n=1 Tax=Ornithinibacillus bavariensis TaxID=545502 RepID=A0A919X9Y9_9BACI|nr:YueI family protein [Ornithinibacillus bavariensis]GIO27225.1 hypothetical protein J43TS3_18360 [Ornithinibacillus bavariensis]